MREVLEASEGKGVDPLAQPYAILDEKQSAGSDRSDRL